MFAGLILYLLPWKNGEGVRAVYGLPGGLY